MNISKRKKLEKIYFNFCYHGDLNSKVYLFSEFEHSYKNSYKFRIVVWLVILFDALKEKTLDLLK